MSSVPSARLVVHIVWYNCESMHTPCIPSVPRRRMAGIQFLMSLLLGQVIAAPRMAHEGRSEDLKIPNPISIGPEQLRLLQGYLEHADPMEKNASNLTREAVILHLILLHDYDKSGRLDGLETMQLLRGILSHKMQEPPHPTSVILLVDDILDKQDINRDGFLDAHELLVPAVYGDDALLKVEENSAVHVAIPPPQGAQNENKAESQETVINVEERSVQNESQGVINEALPSPEEPLVGESEELIGHKVAEGLQGEVVEEVVVEGEM